MTYSASTFKFFSLIIIYTLSSSAVAQNSDYSTGPPWILILPGTISVPYNQSLENEVTDIVTDIAWESGRIEVFDRFDVRRMLMRKFPDKLGALSNSVILSLGESTECDEALIVDIESFSQIGVSWEKDNDEEDSSDNIRSNLSVQFRRIDIVSGTEIDHFLIRVSHTGGNKRESEEKVLELFRDVAFNEIRVIYQLVSEVLAVEGLNINLHLGTNIALSGESFFHIIEPEIVEIIDDEEIISPGKPAALACVEGVDDSINQAVIIRQWSAVGPGFYAYEVTNTIQGLQFYFLPRFPGDYLYIGGQYHYSPLNSWDFGGGLHYASMTDSYDEINNGVGFNVFLARRLITFTTLRLYAKVETNLDIPFKEDDDGQIVTTAVFSGSLGISCNLMLTKKSDIEINLGYRLSTKASHWTYSEKEEEYDAFWIDDAPIVDLTSFYFTIGYKFILF